MSSGPSDSQAEPDPARTFASALSKFQAFAQRDNAAIHPKCASRLLHHGGETEHAIVLLHGLANCPAQYVTLAADLHKRGYTVLVPRIPHNGLVNRMTDDLKNLTVQELHLFAHQVLDVACGLAKRITVLGHSGGGTIAAWVAQFRPEVDSVVLVSPFFGLAPIFPIWNRAANQVILSAMQLLPNLMTPMTEAPEYNYPRFATRGLGATMRLGAEVLRAARIHPPTARRIRVIMNENDRVVNNGMTESLAHLWKRFAGGQVSTYTFKRDLHLIHDVIDPKHRGQQVDVVYPVLIDAVMGDHL